MTDIDQALGRHFLERLLAQLTLIWTDVAGLTLKLETVDQHMETAQMVSVSEPTLSLMMEARLGGLSATMALLIPWSAIAPVADQFAAREDGKGLRSRGRRDVGAPRRRQRRDDRARRGGRRSRCRSRPCWRSRRATCCGSTRPPPRGITIYADKVPVHTGRPGRSGSRRAVQVTGRLGGGVVSADDALVRLGQSTAEACLGVLEMFAAGKVSIGEVTTTRRLEVRLRRHAGAVRGDVGLLRRRRHRRQRLPDHARRRAQPRRLDDGHGRARGPGRHRALRARAVRGL